jgi:hypothetical protein
MESEHPDGGLLIGYASDISVIHSLLAIIPEENF